LDFQDPSGFQKPEGPLAEEVIAQKNLASKKSAAISNLTGGEK
jgi:hypothetical protein